jgi:Holliday junction resolvase-like predicted endonuclease
MHPTFQVTKASGQTELFDEEKIRRSLRRSGADESLVNQVLQELEGHWTEGMTTKTIFKKAFKLLKRLHRPTAARYTLKQAMLDFGNSGFPFEDFVAEILKTRGYEVKTRQLLPGACVQHEVDVVAESADDLIWVECKYHPMAGSVSNVKIPLYIHSRFRDLAQYRAQATRDDQRSLHAWIITNTRFSDDAMRYGRCAELQLIGWNYPSGKSLREMIEQAGLHPLTCLTTLTRREKIELLESGIVLSKSLTYPGAWSDRIHVSKDRLKHIMQEAREICGSN